MLEALDHVDRRSRSHAYGAAEDVPRQIRDGEEARLRSRNSGQPSCSATMEVSLIR